MDASGPRHPPLSSSHAVDPRVVRSRTAVLEAATLSFLEHGYVETSLDDIAHRAGVAKRTIYNVVGDKEAVFRCVLDAAIDTAERFSVEVVENLASGDDIETELRDAALQLARAVLTGRIVALRRLLIAEARRFPELAASYYQRAPGRVINGLAAALQRYDQRGELTVDEPVRAAEQFAFLVLGAALDRALFATDDTPVDEALLTERALTGVDTFVRAHRPTSAASAQNNR